MDTQNSGKKEIIVPCPERWWFRVGVYASFVYALFSPAHQQGLTSILIIVLLYTLRSPDFDVYDDGIQIKLLWETRFIEFSSIKRVMITPTQLFIWDGFFPFPLFAFAWRRNFKEVTQILRDNLDDKVKRLPFPIPLSFHLI
jgi:hypothetical protein